MKYLTDRYKGVYSFKDSFLVLRGGEELREIENFPLKSSPKCLYFLVAKNIQPWTETETGLVIVVVIE